MLITFTTIQVDPQIPLKFKTTCEIQRNSQEILPNVHVRQ